MSHALEMTPAEKKKWKPGNHMTRGSHGNRYKNGQKVHKGKSTTAEKHMPVWAHAKADQAYKSIPGTYYAKH